MALNKLEIAIPFVSGINTQADDKQLKLGTFRKIENGHFQTPGKLRKRNGHDSLDLTTTLDAIIEETRKLSTFKNELLLFNNINLYSFIESQKKWSCKGTTLNAVPDSTQIIRNNKAQKNLDAIHLEGLNLHVYQDDDGVHLTIIDNDSKSFILAKTNLSSTGINPKIVSRNNEVYCFFTEGTDIKYRKFNLFDYNNINTEVVAISTLHASNKIYDVISIEDRIIMGNNNVANILSFQSLKEDDSITTPTTAGSDTAVCLSIHKDSNSRLIASYATSTDAKVAIYTYTFSVNITVPTSIETISSITNITSGETTIDGEYEVFYEVSSANAYDHMIKKNTINLAASVGTASVLIRSVGLASKTFRYNNDNYFKTIHDNTLQSTYFVSNSSGQLVSKINPDTAGDITVSSLPRVTEISTGEFLLTNSIKGRLVEENGTFFSLLGINETNLSFTIAENYQNTSLANNLHIAGGFLKMYDGSQVTEHSFHVFPEGLVNDSTATTGGFLSDGTYEYKAVYAWTDAQGIVHRSAPSEAVNIVLSGGTSTQTQTIEIPTLRLTDKEDVIIELYRTETVGTIFYKVSSTQSPTFNDKTVDSLTITDTISDADLIDNELLYTTGDVLDNIAAPASSLIESYQNRIFVTTPKSNKVNYSKIQFEGFPIEFNDSLEQVIPNFGGDNVALKAMDDKLIIFKENSIYYLSGDGPNNLGEQNTFIEPELISSNIGCVSADSVVLTPAGIAFKSNKGIYLLGRSLSLQYAGAPVEEFNNLNITSAIVVASKNQIRFTNSDGDALVFNYNVDQWATYNNHKAISATVLNDVYYYLRADNFVYKENANFDDNGSVINLKLETGWMSFAGVQNFQRVYKMLLLGEFKSAHKLKIKIAYDYKDIFTEQKIINTADFIEALTYGSSTTYGDDSTYGGDGDLYQIRLDFSRQKCQSIKISIEDLQDSAGEGLDLSNILLVVGTKSTEDKVDNVNTYGSSA